MDWKQEWKPLALIVAAFIACFYLPVDALQQSERLSNAFWEAFHLVRWYAREHVLLCLVPAFFIAGAIGVFVSQASVMRYLGPQANKFLAYGVAAVSGTILAVCSCTVLPLFAGIYKMGAGLGPACAFLYSGPAINVLAIVLTARILGMELGIARAVGAIGFSIVIGLAMHFTYRKEETEKADAQMGMPEPEVVRPLWQTSAFFAAMIGVLVFANWGSPNDYEVTLKDGSTFHAAVVKAPENPQVAGAAYNLEILSGPEAGSERHVSVAELASKKPVPGVWTSVWAWKWPIASLFSAALGLILGAWFGVAWWKILLAALPVAGLALVLPSGGLWVLIPFSLGTIGLSLITSSEKGEPADWFYATWSFAKQILPLLLFGVLVAGFLLGRPDHEGVIPGKYVEMLVGASPDRFLEMTGLAGSAAECGLRPLWPLWTNFFASVFGAFMYFATLTEVPILQGLIGAGMGKGPALALLLAGPALSLPSMLVLRGIMGTRKTIVFVSLVVVMATISGMLFGMM